MNYRDLEIWVLARQLTGEIHKMTLNDLPNIERYEEGSQIRRSIKSVRSNIVEGYGRRRYKQDFIRFLTYALASCDETTDHLEILHETGSLGNAHLYEAIHEHLDELGRKLNNFIASVDRGHQSVREPLAQYGVDDPIGQESSFEYRVSSIEHQDE